MKYVGKSATGGEVYKASPRYVSQESTKHPGYWEVYDSKTGRTSGPLDTKEGSARFVARLNSQEAAEPGHGRD